MILSDAGQNSQLHLRIIAAHEVIIASSRPENATNLLALLGPGRNVLKIRIRAGKSTGYRNSLLKMRMNTTGFTIYQGL